MWTVVALLLIGLAIVWITRSQTAVSREHLMKRMDAEPASSYAQTTNHFPMPEYSMGPISGFETPFRVNAWHAYME